LKVLLHALKRTAAREMLGLLQFHKRLRRGSLLLVGLPQHEVRRRPGVLDAKVRTPAGDASRADRWVQSEIVGTTASQVGLREAGRRDTHGSRSRLLLY
jgi:hypothetical protein